MVAITEPRAQESLRDQEPPLIADPVETARSAGLRYFTDARPGIQRKRVGRHFRYIGTDGEPIRDPDELQRIKSIGIPPAWSDVWICPSPRGHLQATGRDVKGRKQYRYHPRWREIRDETKYTRMIAFGEALPLIRERANLDLGQHCMSREKVLATVVTLLDLTAIRVGNEEYARENQSYGLTTMRTRHVRVNGSTLHFHFQGKSHKEHVLDVRNPRLARAVKRCQDLPGHELFQYVDEDGQRRAIDSADVNDYLRSITGENFTAKDFRTWHGTVRAADALAAAHEAESDAEAKRRITAAIQVAADHLGNTPAICRKSYVHPAIIESYQDGSLFSTWHQVVAEARSGATLGLEPEEIAVLAILQQRLEADQSEKQAVA